MREEGRLSHEVRGHDPRQRAAGEIELADEVFGLPPPADILARMVNWQLAKRRAGTHKVKGRSEVSGSNRQALPAEGHRPRRASAPAR